MGIQKPQFSLFVLMLTVAACAVYLGFIRHIAWQVQGLGVIGLVFLLLLAWRIRVARVVGHTVGGFFKVVLVYAICASAAFLWLMICSQR